jgi:glycosyltransferase involved in cell wall biosynthesis
MNGTVTVVVTTLDEKLHVERVVRSARDLGPVYVVDAGSNDGTGAIAKGAGARVV